MEVILRSENVSREVTVRETDSDSCLKEIFVKSTGEDLPKSVCVDQLSPKLKQACLSSGDDVFISRFNHFQRVSVLSLLLAVFVMAVCGLTLAYKFTRVQPFDYAVIFDAGSTHTEMKVFAWQSNKFRGTGLVTEIHSCRMEGGIGDVLRKVPRKAGQYLDECLQQSVRMISPERRSHSPVFLAATAGMRLLKLEEPQTTREILGNISRVLQSSGLLFDETSVRIISGKEEAVSAWVSANYLLQSLHPKRGSTLGSLDLGGASTQIAFVKNDASAPSVSDVLLKLFGEEYDVAALSYLCFGQSQLYKRYLVTLLETEQHGSNVSISSPCHNDGYRVVVNYEDLLSPCTRTTYLSSFQGSSITVIGKYNSFSCRKAVGDLLSTEKCRSNFAKEYCFSRPPKHDPDINFVATAGFYYTVSNLKVRTVNGTSSDFQAAGTSYCETPWDHVIRVNDSNNSTISGFETEVKSKLCFNANYNFLLLTEGYGFTNETWSKISFVNKINGVSLGWELGFAVRSTNLIPEEGKIDQLPGDVFAALLFVFAFIIGSCFTLLIARVTSTASPLPPP